VNWTRLLRPARLMASMRAIKPINRVRRWADFDAIKPATRPCFAAPDRPGPGPARQRHLRLLREYRRTDRPPPVGSATDRHTDNPGPSPGPDGEKYNLRRIILHFILHCGRNRGEVPKTLTVRTGVALGYEVELAFWFHYCRVSKAAGSTGGGRYRTSDDASLNV
jgi:hypothetical protein